MYAMQPKKLLILNILDILQRYSDADHRLDQKVIQDILRKEYEMDVDRKAIKRNLMNLLDFGYNLKCSEFVRKNKSGEDETIYTDWYLLHDFSDAELRLLIDSILFSKNIPHNQRRRLIEKIEKLSSKYFNSKMRHVQGLQDNQPQNKELLYTIEILDEAIDKSQQVEFHYADFGIDKEMHLRTDQAGIPRTYLVNPYQMVATNGRYYLICNMDAYDAVSHYRVDHIRDIRILDTPVKPQKDVKGLEHGLDLSQHTAERVYMFTGESQPIVMRAAPDMAGEVIDWFGKDVTFTRESETSMLIRLTANVNDMRFWALQYAPYVTVLAPQSLVDMVHKDLETALQRYKTEKE